MPKVKSAVLASVLSAAVLSPFPAHAVTAYTNNPIVLRAGPGAGYPEVEQLDPQTRVWILACREGRDWCDVSHGRTRGWVRGDRLSLPDEARASDTIPMATFDLDSYWDEHYRHEAFYADRGRWEDASRQVAQGNR